MILFRIPNLKELQVIYEENPEGYNEQEWMQLYYEATSENFSFLYINNKFPKGQTMYTFRPYLQIIQLEIHMHYYRHVLVEMRQNQ